MWLGVAGFIVIVVLMARHVNGAIMLGILFCTLISWIPGHGASYLGKGADIPGGLDRLREFRQVVSVPDATKTSLTWNFSAFGNSQLWVALITFLYLDFLDATGTMCVERARVDGGVGEVGVGWGGVGWMRLTAVLCCSCSVAVAVVCLSVNSVAGVLQASTIAGG